MVVSDPRTVVAFDTETHLIQDGLLAPPIVCGSIAAWDGSQSIGELLDKDQTLEAFRQLLSPGVILTGANIPYDLLCCAVEWARRGVNLLPQIFRKYFDGEVFDVLRAEELHAIANGHLGYYPDGGKLLNEDGTVKSSKNTDNGASGNYSLFNVCQLVLNRDSAKANDEWRKRYFELEGIPIEQWPFTARTYPVDDAVNTLEAALAQLGHFPRGDGKEYPSDNLHDHSLQACAAWVLHLADAWGISTDSKSVEALAQAAQLGRDAGRDDFIRLGFIREDGSGDTGRQKRAVAEAYGATGICAPCGGEGRIYQYSKKDPTKRIGKGKGCKECNSTGLDLESAIIPMTEPSKTAPKGNVQIGRDVLIESGDETLMDLAAYKEDDKISDSCVPFLRKGVDAPITLRSNPILDTGRVSYSGLIQTLPRSVSPRLAQVLKTIPDAPIGVRDCFIARKGYLFYSNDYPAGELITFSESALARVGFSEMGKSILEGKDIHSDVAANVLGISYEEFVSRKKEKRFKDLRQAVKPIDFGAGGGIGPAKIVLQQRKQGPDTIWPGGPSQVWDYGSDQWVEGYKGLRFCVLTGVANQCGKTKVTKYNRQSIPPTCLDCIEAAKKIRKALFDRYPEFQPYLDWHAENAGKSGRVVQHYSGRVRGGLGFCAEANGDFQALLADIAKRAQIRVSYEQYCVEDSPLFGSRSIVFAHDELFGEAPEDRAAEVSERVSAIMQEELAKGCPNFGTAAIVEPTIMKRWYKDAECVRDSEGRLIPWEPRRVAA